MRHGARSVTPTPADFPNGHSASLRFRKSGARSGRDGRSAPSSRFRGGGVGPPSRRSRRIAARSRPSGVHALRVQYGGPRASLTPLFGGPSGSYLAICGKERSSRRCRTGVRRSSESTSPTLEDRDVIETILAHRRRRIHALRVRAVLRAPARRPKRMGRTAAPRRPPRLSADALRGAPLTLRPGPNPSAPRTAPSSAEPPPRPEPARAAPGRAGGGAARGDPPPFRLPDRPLRGDGLAPRRAPTASLCAQRRAAAPRRRLEAGTERPLFFLHSAIRSARAPSRAASCPRYRSIRPPWRPAQCPRPCPPISFPVRGRARSSRRTRSLPRCRQIRRCVGPSPVQRSVSSWPCSGS